MKNMLIGLGIGMAGGITLATYALTNPKTKQNADKMLNTALDLSLIHIYFSKKFY